MSDLWILALAGVLLLVDAVLSGLLMTERHRHAKTEAALRWWQRHSRIPMD